MAITESLTEETIWQFSTMEERDYFINANFPKRKCEEAPGCYSLPNGGELGVFCNRVTYYPPE